MYNTVTSNVFMAWDGDGEVFKRINMEALSFNLFLIEDI